MTSIGLPSLNVPYPTKGMMPRGKVRRILRNAAWGTFAQNLLTKDEGTSVPVGVSDLYLIAAFRIPVFMRTLSSWLNKLVEADFVLEHFGEPWPGDEAVQERPGLQDAQIVAYFLHVRTRKPAGMTG
jgi:hypothetical protein